MRNIIKRLSIVFALIITSVTFAQAKKPTIMIVPSDLWCGKNNYMTEYKNKGAVVRIPDYKKALQDNAELLQVIAKLNGLMADRGFPLKNLETVIKSLEAESAENAMMASKSGASLSESPTDRLKKVAKADIIMQLTWTLNTTGPKKSVNFILQGLDTYTNKQVATATGTGAPSFSADMPVLLEEAVLTHIDNFNSSLQKHFDDMFENGREITLKIKKFSTWNGNLEKEYAGKELSSLIEDWMASNTVKGRFNTSDATENMMLFEQVRIPLYDAQNRAMDARSFLKGLQSYLKTAPIAIPNKLVMKGLGQAEIVLGEK